MKNNIFILAIFYVVLTAVSVGAADTCQVSLDRLHNKYEKLQNKYNDVKDRPRSCPTVKPIGGNNISIDTIGIEPKILLKSFSKIEERVITTAITENAEWLGINIGASNVDINIIGTESSTFTQSLVANTVNDGRESITIPSNLAVGKYKIQIKSITGNIIGISNTTFVVKAPVTPPSTTPTSAILTLTSNKTVTNVNGVSTVRISDRNRDTITFNWKAVNPKSSESGYTTYSSTCTDVTKNKAVTRSQNIANAPIVLKIYTSSRASIQGLIPGCTYRFIYTVTSPTNTIATTSADIIVESPTRVN